ncbi:MAG TPA: cobalamin-dependent protein [Syntrophales bacterium]|jgi:methylmalonyl-CoA mutase C-terminal domain/subunit|nr:cobalamin-dependent protein [Syntrophales bacterium]HOH73958.1 cobalamin-dependent protein [Syntrophales bacterium]HPN09259.1 cobalamin-dependent protein [Syntrophales bacterium]HPX81710.1 cobalamin-dependent protein [Syntrophales bacterium]HQK80242.1 cobalamin-dependent protein [Syntrophales bacterium]
MSSNSTIRILMAKLGEGYEDAVGKLCIAFREAGYEVVYVENQRPEAIVASALQEAVDHIGITTLPGARIEDIARVMELLKKEDLSYVRVTAGGFLDYNDIHKVKEAGVVEFFPKGTSISELITWAKANITLTDDWSK